MILVRLAAIGCLLILVGNVAGLLGALILNLALLALLALGLWRRPP